MASVNSDGCYPAIFCLQEDRYRTNKNIYHLHTGVQIKGGCFSIYQQQFLSFN